MDVTLPNLGEGAESGTVVSILVKEGDQITKGQTILELENEKAVAPIPSPVSGTVAQIRVKEGQKLSVGQVILTTAETGAPPHPGPLPQVEEGEASTPSRQVQADAPAPGPEPAEPFSDVQQQP